MLTPLEIENKKFSRQMMNGYSVEDVDDFLDEITVDYEKMYKDMAEMKKELENIQNDLRHYKSIEETLQNTLVMAQSTADEVKELAKKQADQILKDAEENARKSTDELSQNILMKRKELEDMQQQFSVYKVKMESLLISQLELLKDNKTEI